MNTRRSLTMALAAGSALLAVLPLQQTQAAKSRTARSAMVTINVPANMSVMDDGAYTYSNSCVASWFSYNKTETKFSEPGCKGKSDNPVSSTALPQAFINKNSCDFLNGTLKESSPGPGTCTNSKTDKTSTLTKISYTIKDSVNSSSCLQKADDASVTPQGTIASEAVVSYDTRRRGENVSFIKYSFYMGQDYSFSNNGTIVEGLTATVNGGVIRETQSEEFGNLTVTLPPENVGLNFLYKGSNGGDGDVGLLTSSNGSYNVGCRQEQSGGVRVNAILGSDPTVGSCDGDERDSSRANDGEGGDLVTWIGNPINLSSAEGNVSVSVNGSIKDPDGLDNLNIVANKNIRVENCSK